MQASLLLPLVSLVAGAALGLVSSVAISTIRQRQTVTLRLLDQYFETRQEVVQAVSNLTHIDNYKELGHEARSHYKDAIAKLFYKHYDFLPQAVLDSILLLHVALSHSDGRLFGVKNGAIVPLTEEEIPGFIDSCTMYHNASLVGALALRSSSPIVVANQAIKLHARHVLFTLNEFASLAELLVMEKRFRKVAKL